MAPTAHAQWSSSTKLPNTRISYTAPWLPNWSLGVRSLFINIYPHTLSNEDCK